MSSNRLMFDGLTELREALRNLPVELTGEASKIIEGVANGAAHDVKVAYPVRTTGLHPGPHRKSRWYAPGNLRDGVTVTHFPGGKFSAGAIVKSAAKHAWLFDNGSQARHYLGANRGSMPPTHLFVRTMIKARRQMWQRLRELLVRHGLSVSGEA